MCVHVGPESSDLATIFHSLNHQSLSLGRTLILQLFGSSSLDFFGRLWILRPDGYSFFPNGLLSQTVCSLSTLRYSRTSWCYSFQYVPVPFYCSPLSVTLWVPNRCSTSSSRVTSGTSTAGVRSFGNLFIHSFQGSLISFGNCPPRPSADFLSHPSVSLWVHYRRA